MGHFWVGSMCLAASSSSSFPRGVAAVTDTITIREDMGNRMPGRSWMLYLLEVFDRRNVPIELNLICQFNDRDNFWAIFGGVNRYKFTKVLPIVGHSYLRQIVMRKDSRSIEYSVTDQNTKETENFVFNAGGGRVGITYEGKNQFTGIEWWNKAGGPPFPVRYRVEVSNLMYGIPDDVSLAITYRPYSRLVPNSDSAGAGYPVLFDKPMIKDGCICYAVADGASNTGMKFALA